MMMIKFFALTTLFVLQAYLFRRLSEYIYNASSPQLSNSLAFLGAYLTHLSYIFEALATILVVYCLLGGFQDGCTMYNLNCSL